MRKWMIAKIADRRARTASVASALGVPVHVDAADQDPFYGAGVNGQSCGPPDHPWMQYCAPSWIDRALPEELV